jgi:two-component system KDP operon response regulator KdpE
MPIRMDSDRPAGPLAGSSLPGKGRRRVLLAEDDEDVRIVFEMVLSEHFEVTCAASGSEALTLALSTRPDVVLIDWSLPDVSGGDVVKRLRQLGPDYARMPVVVVSGATAVKSLAASVNAVPCPKPCDVDQLLAAIEHALDPARAR